MRRLMLLPLTAGLLWSATAADVWAQSAAATWPAIDLQPGWGGPGFYFSITKMVMAILLFWLWIFTTDWLSRDAQELRLDWMRWNPIATGCFVGAFLLMWEVPSFGLGYSLLLMAYAGPLAGYVVYRNRRVPADQRVLTPEHLKHWFAERMSSFGVKVKTEAEDPHTAGPPLILNPHGANERDSNIRLISARQCPGFLDARVLLADCMWHRCDAVMLDFVAQGMSVKYMVDGVWHDGDPWEREKADPLLEALKVLCGMNPQDRVKRQEGPFAMEFMQEKFTATLVSQGTPTGERAVMQVEGRKCNFANLEALGMRQKMEEQLREIFSGSKGFVLLSGLPANGLRTTTQLFLKGCDRFMREFYTVEDVQNRYEAMENLQLKTYDSKQGQSPVDVFEELFHAEPHVIVCRDLVNGETVRLLCEEVKSGRMVLGTIRAKDSAEALLRVLALKTPPATFAEALVAVLNQRLVRKLCTQCKEAYAPTPDMLQKLGIPEGRVQAFYRPPSPPAEGEKHQPCPECNDIGYVGRTAIYELLVADPALRKMLAATPKLDLLRQAARKAGMRSLQEEGILLVARGITSLQELTRVMKQ
jgi:type II secretory ATPase GspE/PulE/Tfp pilus assembly ATPase PilB-like protein